MSTHVNIHIHIHMYVHAPRILLHLCGRGRPSLSPLHAVRQSLDILLRSYRCNNQYILLCSVQRHRSRESAKAPDPCSPGPCCRLPTLNPWHTKNAALAPPYPCLPDDALVVPRLSTTHSETRRSFPVLAVTRARSQENEA